MTRHYVPASRSPLVLLSMHVVAVAAAWPINGEAVTWLQGLGGLVILVSVGAVVVRAPVPTVPIQDALVPSEAERTS